jgi:biopolymer transport protein ExbD
MARLSTREKADKERKYPAEIEPEFQIAPMIDILLVLLVFFMSISSTEVLQSNRTISLPVAADAKPASKNSPGQVIVNIAWLPITDDGSIEISGKSYPDANSIIPPIAAAIQANPVARVLIRADKNVKWEYMKTIMKAVAQAGVANVTFSVVNKDEGPAH